MSAYSVRFVSASIAHEYSNVWVLIQVPTTTRWVDLSRTSVASPGNDARSLGDQLALSLKPVVLGVTGAAVAGEIHEIGSFADFVPAGHVGCGKLERRRGNEARRLRRGYG